LNSGNSLVQRINVRAQILAIGTEILEGAGTQELIVASASIAEGREFNRTGIDRKIISRRPLSRRKSRWAGDNSILSESIAATASGEASDWNIGLGAVARSRRGPN